MRKTSTILCASLLMCGAVVPVQARNYTPRVKQVADGQILSASSVRRSVDKRVNAQLARIADNENLWELPLVTEVEGGTARNYSRDCHYFGLDYAGQLYTSSEFGQISEVVTGEDSKIYFKNPFSGMLTNTYLVGTVADGKVTFSFPQKIYAETYEDWEADETGETMKTDYYYAFKLNYSNNGETSRMELDLTDPTVSFSITDDGYVQLGDAFIGMVREEIKDDEDGKPQSLLTWAGFADADAVYTTVTAEPVKMPEGVKPEKWIFSSYESTRYVDVAFDGDDVYVAGIFQGLPEATVKGVVSDGQVTFSGPTYLGEASSYNHYAYLVPSTYEINPDEATGEDETQFFPEETLVFDYDAEGRSMISTDAGAFAVSTIPDKIFLIEGYTDVAFMWEDTTTPMTPDNPEIMAYEYDDDYGMGFLAYALATWSTDGRLLDTSSLYYNFFLDDEMLTLEPDEYFGLQEPMTEIPYAFEDFTDIYFWGDYSEAIIYATGFDRIGVRAVYVNSDGEKTYSDIVYDDGTIVNSGGVGVRGVETDATVVSECMYDVNGVAVAKPAAGSLVIRVVTLSDGTVRTEKYIAR